jgi:cell division protein ZapB
MQGLAATPPTYNPHFRPRGVHARETSMSKIEDVAERVERLLLRHEELKRTNALLEQQLRAVTAERDSLRSRLSAARTRIDALLDRLPAEADIKPGDGT